MRDVWITGLGCWTAIGEDPDAFFDALCRGESGVDGSGPFPGRGPVASIPGGPHLSSKLAERVVSQALGGLDPREVALIGASTSGDMVNGEVEYERVLGGAVPGPDYLWAQRCDRPAEVVARTLGFQGPRTSVSTACSSGAAAAGIAAEWVATGSVEAAIVFGTDALCRLTVHGFGSLSAVSSDRARPFDTERTGLSLGEGAAALLLESPQSARRRGARVYGRIAGYGNATDAHHMTAPHPEGRGAIRAIRAAGTASVGWVCAHGTATPLNDAMEAVALSTALPGVAISSIKGAVGHTLGAAGVVELVAAVLAVDRGQLPPNTGCAKPMPDLPLVHRSRPEPIQGAMSVNFAFGGHNAAIRVERVEPGSGVAEAASPGAEPIRGAVLDWVGWVPGGTDGLLERLRRGGPLHTELDDPSRPPAIPAGRWRRMSRLSRIAALAVLELRERHPELDWESMPMVHGSALGEVVPSGRFLDRMFTEGPDRASPLAFQNSVYNATAAQLSLAFDLRGPVETLSSGMATGLMALRRGFEWTRRAPVALVLVGDDLNPITLGAHLSPHASAGESMVAALVTAGEAIEIRTGAQGRDPWCRGAALPYERRFVAGAGVHPEQSIGLCCSNGLLSLLAGAPEVLDQDDGLSVLARKLCPGR